MTGALADGAGLLAAKRLTPCGFAEPDGTLRDAMACGTAVPAVGAVDIATTQRTVLQIAELVEDEQRMIAGATGESRLICWALSVWARRPKGSSTEQMA